MSMEADSFYVGAYWGPREEPVEACARRLASFLSNLGDLHPLLATWYGTGASRRDALARRVDLSAAALQRLLLAGQNHRDDDGTVIGDLGYSVALWNGQDSEVGLMAHCGAWATLAGPVSNSIILELPEPQGEGLALFDRDLALGVMRATVDAWQPSWCVWTSRHLIDAQGAGRTEGVVGWSTFLTSTNGLQTGSLPPKVTVERVDGGLLLTVEGAADSASPPSVSAIRRALGTAVHWESFQS